MSGAEISGRLVEAELSERKRFVMDRMVRLEAKLYRGGFSNDDAICREASRRTGRGCGEGCSHTGLGGFSSSWPISKS